MAGYMSKTKKELIELVESLSTQLMEIKKKIIESKKALEREKANTAVFENLFISFAEKNDNKILLLDNNSLILYASPAVVRLLNAVNRDKLIGHSFLKMFSPWDSIRVEKKIRDVCFKEGKKKIKDVNFITNGMLQMKLKFYPVQYMDQPAVKVIIKHRATDQQ